MGLRTEHNLGKDGEDTKKNIMVNTMEGRTAFQRGLDRLEKWTNQKLIMFTKTNA